MRQSLKDKACQGMGGEGEPKAKACQEKGGEVESKVKAMISHD